MSKRNDKRNQTAATETTAQAQLEAPAAQAQAQAPAPVYTRANGTAMRPGGRCAAVWQWHDEYLRAHGRMASVQEARAECAQRMAEGDRTVNTGNWQIETYEWRKAHGVKGRVAVPAQTAQAVETK